MSEIFLKVINMSISASYIVLAVLLLRLMLKKAPRWITVVLWSVAAVRLVCPFSIESALSLIPSSEVISPEIMMDKTPTINTGIPIINSTLNLVISESFTPNPGDSANPLQIWIPVLTTIWIVGMVALLVYTVISYAKVKHKIGTAVLYKDNIYQSENVVSPFVLGLIKPKIYLPFNISKRAMEHVVAHETAHIRRKDQLWKPLGFVLLTFHWFNPLAWIGYAMFCRDIELACDEKVIKELDHDARADYSEALLTCGAGRKAISACPLAFGEVGVKKRIKSVLNYKKPTLWIMISAIVVCAAVAVCFLTDPANDRIFFDGSLSCTQFVDENGKSHMRDIHFDEETAEEILAIINSCQWTDDGFSFHGDIVFHFNDPIAYMAYSGMLLDHENNRCAVLDSDTHARLNLLIFKNVGYTSPIYIALQYSYGMAPSLVPTIEIADGILYTLTDGNRERIGTVKKTSMTYFNFDTFFIKYDGLVQYFDYSESAKNLRLNNKTAYEVIPDTAQGIELYYIMEQKTGETIIVYGQYDGNGEKKNEIYFVYQRVGD